MLSKLFYLCVIILSLGQFAVLSKSQDSSVYLFDISTAVFAIYGICYFLLVKRSLSIPTILIFFIGFIFIAVFSLFVNSYRYSYTELATAFFYIVRYSFYVFSAIVICNMLKKSLISKRRIYDTFIFSGVFIALVGIVQLFLLPDFTRLDISMGWDPHRNRLASTFFDPNFTGAYLVLIIGLLFEEVFTKRNVTKKTLVVLVFLLIALFMTFSRSAWLMMGILVLFYGLFRNKYLLIFTILIAFSAYFAVPRVQTRISGVTDPSDSARFRLISWQNTATVIRDNFWFGVGYNGYRYVQKDYGYLTLDTYGKHSGAGSDSSLLFVFATTGVIGFSFFLAGHVFALQNFVVEKRKGWLLGIFLIFGLLVGSQFINSLFYPQIMFIFYALLVSIQSPDLT